MATRTRNQLKRERFLKIYFHYWKLQNNPEYIEYWKKQTAYLQEYQKNPIETLRKTDDNFFTNSVNLSIKFGLRGILVDPYRKIEWEDLINFNKVDSDIIRGLAFSPFFSPVKVQRFHREVEPNDQDETGNPILRLLIDLSYDKKDILNQISGYIDKWREIRKIELSKSRDQISKFYKYAQVWDLRKGFPKKSFREIARELKEPTPTVVSQFKRAYELLYNKPYESTDLKSIRRLLIRKTTCKGCPDYPCKIPCPDVQIQLEELDVKQAHRLDPIFIDRYGEKKSMYELASNKEAYRKWQEESQ